MTDYEKLIEDAWWRAMEAGELPRPRGDGTARQLFEAGYRAAEKAHTPTDDEREALAGVIRDADMMLPAGSMALVEWSKHLAGSILAAGSRHTVTPSPSAAREFLKAALAESDADEAEGGAGWDVEVDARTVLELLDEVPGPMTVDTDPSVDEYRDLIGFLRENADELGITDEDPPGEPTDADLTKLANDAHHRMVDEAEANGGWYGFSHSRDAWQNGFETGYRARASVAERGERQSE